MLQGFSSTPIDDTLFDRLNRVCSFALAAFYVDSTFDQWLIRRRRAGTINVLSRDLQRILNGIKLSGEVVDAGGVLIDAFVKQAKYPDSLRTLLLSPPFHEVLKFYRKNIIFIEKLFDEYTVFKTTHEETKREKMLQALERLSLQSEPKPTSEVLDMSTAPLLSFSPAPSSSSSTIASTAPAFDYDYVSSLFTPENATFIKLANKISSKEQREAKDKFINMLVDLMQQKDFKLVFLILNRESVQSLKRVNESLVAYHHSITGTKSDEVSIVWDILQAVSSIQDSRAGGFDFKANFEDVSAKALSKIESRAQPRKPKP